MHGISRQMKGSVFKYYNCHFQGRPRPEPWRSWRDLILQRVPAVVTSPNGASPQSKHCNPPIPSHSRISQLVPPEYGGNLGRGKIGTQTGVIFASPFLSFPASSDPPASLSAKRPSMTIHLCHHRIRRPFRPVCFSCSSTTTQPCWQQTPQN